MGEHQRGASEQGSQVFLLISSLGTESLTCSVSLQKALLVRVASFQINDGV